MVQKRNILISFFKKKSFAYLAIFSIAFLVFLYILIPPTIYGPDSFYHTKISLMIKKQGLIQNFPWTYFTTYHDLFVDHHFGYHLLLIPFLSIPTPKNLDSLSTEIDPLIKGKLATAFFAAIAFLLIYWFLRKLEVKKPFLWSLVPFLVWSFLARISLIRAPVVSVSILILGIYFILKRKYLALSILSFFYVWIYGAWPLIFLAVIIFCLADAIQKAVNNNSFKKFLKYFFSKENIFILLSCAFGLVLGLIINPYFPKTFPFYWFQTIKIAILNYHSKIGVGAEWYPYSPGKFYLSTLPILIPYIFSLAWFIFKYKEQDTKRWFLAIFSLFFLFYTLKARRNIEYFTPIAIFFSALIISDIFKGLDWQEIKKQIITLFKSRNNIFYYLVSIAFLFLFIFFLFYYSKYGLIGLHQTYTKSNPYNLFQNASHWLKENSKKGEIVFQSDWDIFPQLFYFNTKNYYINGLDQTFFYEKNKKLYKTWANLVSGKTNPNRTANILKEKFNASFVFLDKNDKKFGNLLKRSPGLKKVYEDNQAIIYKIELR